MNQIERIDLGDMVELRDFRIDMMAWQVRWDKVIDGKTVTVGTPEFIRIDDTPEFIEKLRQQARDALAKRCA